MSCGSQVSPDGDAADAADTTDVRAVADVTDAPSPIDASDDTIALDVAQLDVAPVDACSGGTTVASCGPRCERCASPANAAPTCDGTRCNFTCNAGFGDCDTRVDNGCEATLDSLDHCGACGARCVAPMNATATCGAGRCEWRCDVGFERVMDRCERVRVRPILPQSTTYTASNVITFEWTNPGGVDEYEVVLGQTRSAIATASGTRVRGATSLRWPTALTNDNTWFWQVRAYAMGAEVSRSAIWAFRPTLRRAQPPLRENLLRFIVDVDCDGEEDIAIPDGDSEATWGVYFYNHTDIARGTYARSSRFILFPMSRLVTVTALGDIDGNGCSDLSANGDVLFGNEGALPTRITFSMGASPLYVYSGAPVGDLDRDGYADGFAVPTSTPSAIHIAFGTRSRALRDILPVTASGIIQPRIGSHAIDRDLDGVFDVALTDLMTPTSRGYFRWDGATNAFVRTGTFTAVDGQPVGDISCDGYIDYVARYGDVWLSTPSIPETALGRFQHAPVYLSPRGFVELGDINSDGCDDLAMMWFRFTSDAMNPVELSFHLHFGSPRTSELLNFEYAVAAPSEELVASGPGGGHRARTKQWTSLGGPFVVLAGGGANAHIYRIPLSAPSSGTLAPIYTIPNSPPLIVPLVFALLPNSLLTPITPLSSPWLPRRRARFDLLFTRG